MENIIYYLKKIIRTCNFLCETRIRYHEAKAVPGNSTEASVITAPFWKIDDRRQKIGLT